LDFFLSLLVIDEQESVRFHEPCRRLETAEEAAPPPGN
jgi:hypothetical protein